MFHGLKTALRSQKKLLIIFLLTIFLPAVTLSIFGIIALRNERFRLEKQFREDQTDFVQLFKEEVNQNIAELENELQYLVLTPSIVNNNYDEIIQLVENQLDRNPLSEQFFILYSGEDPLFPPFRPYASRNDSRESADFTAGQKSRLLLSENHEFTDHNYQAAISQLEELLKETKDHNLQGLLMNRIARNQMKQNNFNGAIKTYNAIIENYNESTTSSGTPISVTVRLQLAECYTRSGMQDEALKETLNAFKEINRNFYNLKENQYTAYVEIAREKFYNLSNNQWTTGSSIPDYADDFEKLNTEYQALMEKWQIVNSLKNECVPEISRELAQYGAVNDNRFRYSRRIGTEDFLVLAMLIPVDDRTDPKGIAGIKINDAFLEKNLLNDILATIKPDKDIPLTLSDQEGNLIAGDSILYNKSTNIIAYFDNNFPPWKIEVPGEPTRPMAFSGLYKSFYFWSIMAMMIILVFGVVITGRTITHEKQLLQLKSDFVSSVSHEFKTPISSIKALTEGLIDGSVKDPKRVREYYSVISRDAEDLSRLVGNILDFSKIEEGKKEYDFEETDFNEWLRQTVADFSDKIQKVRIIFQSALKEQPLPAMIDRTSMKLAIDNLLDNAVKFSSEDSEVNVILEKQERNIMVSIKDHGIGIPKDEQEKIFDKFYRGRDSAAYSATGTGLGLTIVKQVVEAHGGEVWVLSEIGKGSIFFMKLLVADIVKDNEPRSHTELKE